MAEISSCFMGEHLAMQLPPEHMENHKAYVQSWIKEISEKPAVLMKAIRDAESSANYLEYQAELISEKEYQKTLSGVREVELDEVIPKERIAIAGSEIRADRRELQASIVPKQSVVKLLNEKKGLVSASAAEEPAHDDRVKRAEALTK